MCDSYEYNDKIIGNFAGIVGTIPCIENGWGKYAGLNVFITYNPTNAYIVDSTQPSRYFTFSPLTLPDGTICYWVMHCPWFSKFSTNLPQIGEYETAILSPNDVNVINVLLNQYYK